MSTLETAVALAATAHEGQRDKAGEPYVLHPLRVMMNLRSAEERIVAVLHDVIEDTDCTLDRLRELGFSEEIVEAVDSVTKREGEPYEDFVARAAANPIGRQVKLADIADNMNLNRIPNPTQRDFDRLEKYRKALALLRGEDPGARD